MKKIYSTYEALFKGFEKGVLDGYVLIMDNDDCFLSYHGSGDEANNYTDVEWDDHVESMNEKVQFRGGGCTDTIEILEAIGIPVERC